MSKQCHTEACKMVVPGIVEDTTILQASVGNNKYATTNICVASNTTADLEINDVLEIIRDLLNYIIKKYKTRRLRNFFIDRRYFSRVVRIEPVQK